MFEQLVWIVPISVVLVGSWRPRGGLLVFAASLPLFGSPPGGPYLAALDVSAVAAIGLSWRTEKPLPSALRWPLGSLVVVSIVSLVPLAYSPPSIAPGMLSKLLVFLPDVPAWSTLHTWRACIDLLLGCALYGAVRRAFGHAVELVAVAVGAGLAFVLVLGLAEHAGLLELGSYRSIDETLHATRLHSLFFHSAWLAQYVVLVTPFAAAGLVTADGPRRACGVALLVLAFVTLVFTEQRGAWFAALAQVTFVAAILWRQLRRDRARIRGMLAVAAGVAGAAALVVALNPNTGSPVLDRLRSATSDLSGRTHLWSASMELFEQRPVLGWGLGGFAAAYDVLRPRGSPDAWPFRDTAHSTYFNVAVERGVLGLAVLAVLAVAVLPGLVRAAKSGPPSSRFLALGLLLSAIGWAVNALVQDLFYIRNIHWLCWILLAAAAPFATGRSADLARAAAKILACVALLALPWRVFALAPSSDSGDLSFGFHELETNAGTSLEWTAGRAVRRVRWENQTLVVPVATGHPRPESHHVDVTLSAGGRELLARDVAGGWTDYRLHLGRPTQEWVVLELEVRPVFRPFSNYMKFSDLPSSHDFRSLGVAMGPIRWEGLERSSHGSGQ